MLFMNKLIDQIRTQFIQRGNNIITDQDEEKLKINTTNNNNKKNNKNIKNKRCCDKCITF